MALLKGSFVLMICQKIAKKTPTSPIVFNIPDRLVALRVSPIFITREWGTDCYRSRRRMREDAKRPFVSEAPQGRPPQHHLSVPLTRGPIIVSLA